jgi:hypothetical protein
MQLHCHSVCGQGWRCVRSLEATDRVQARMTHKCCMCAVLTRAERWERVLFNSMLHTFCLCRMFHSG